MGQIPDTRLSQRIGNGRLTPFIKRSFAPLILITLLTIPALQPLFSRHFTCGFDNAFHLWRAVQAGELLRHGILFSRWAPHMAHGYGYPLFLFQGPLSAYLAATLHLAGFSWPGAVNAVYGFGILASGWTMWLLARDLWGDRGGIVATVAYVYAPFHAYIAFYRASLSETVAWSILPLILWGLHRWQAQGERRGLVTAVIAFILLMITHDVTAYAFFPFVVGWIVIPAWGRKSWAALRRGLVALGAGVAGCAFYWLPSIVERSSIQFERANSAWPFLYVNNFLPFDQLLAWPRNADPALLNDWPPRALGIILLVSAMSGCVTGLRRQGVARWLTSFLALSLIGYLFLVVSLSKPIWDGISILAAFQFPWRFLAPATLIASLLIGTDRTTRFNFTLYAIIILLSVAHWGWFYPSHCPAPADTSLEGMVAWEESTRTLGTTASRELLPATVGQMPQDDQALPVWQARLATADLPPDTQLLHIDNAPLRTEIELETAVPFQARYRAFAFPGWRALIDNKPVDILPSNPEGLITFAVPDGRHTIKVEFGETPLRLIADIISLTSLLTLLIITLKTPSPPHPFTPATAGRLPPHPLKLTTLFAVSLLLLAGKLLLVDSEQTPLRQTHLIDGELTGLARPSTATFGDAGHPNQLRLLGTGELPTAVAADEPLTVILYWQALTPLVQEYQVGLTLVDENGIRWSEEGLRDYRWARNPPPTTGWPTDKYVQTAFFVDVLPGTPPGDYRLQLSLFERHSLTPLTVYNEGQSPGPWLELGQVHIRRPQTDQNIEDIPMQYRLDFTANDVSLWGSHIGREDAAPGDAILVTLFWTAAEDAATAKAVSLSLVKEGTAVHTWPLTLPEYGDGIWRGQFLLRLPAHLDDGDYTWQLAFPDGESIRWASLSVDAPERLFAAPEIETPVGETLGEQATLLGFNLSTETIRPGEAISVDLIWQAEQEMTQSYRVFVHLLGPEGTIIAQSDNEPAAWTRPTTGWQPGEYIIDAHALRLAADAPAGTYTLLAGLYLPGAARLETGAGLDTVPLTAVTVSE